MVTRKTPKTGLRTPEQAKAELERQGLSVAGFAREHGLNQFTVYQVLNGTKKGRRGESHRAAVLLGLKDGVIPKREDAGVQA